MTYNDIPALLTLEQAEGYLNISRVSIWRFVKAGTLTATGTNRSRRITRASIEKFLARIEKGEDVWQDIAASEASTAPAASSTTKRGGAGTSSRPRSALKNAPPASDTPAVKPPSWLKPIG